MSDLAIRVENLGKLYRIGGRQEKYQTLRDTITDTLIAPLRRARSLLNREAYGAADLHDEIWALRDVSFEVKHGEVVGIIGHNGAGKSTLLKILSRITEPTTGYADIYGRIGALLEVGTGFHAELTGRENIYLNGAILGMPRRVIDRKFDEIVDFAGVEKFIDTPVKHYSSGMGLRLGFAVAAHLEPEILIIDEVLAVGDAEFQKKCLGKMSDVANEGRTVLFVSHNLGAIASLCTRGMVLQRGGITFSGAAEESIFYYQNLATSQLELSEIEIRSRELLVCGIEILQNEQGEYLDPSLPVEVRVQFDVLTSTKDLLIGFDLISSDGVPLFRTFHSDLLRLEEVEPGKYTSSWILPGGLLRNQNYYLQFLAGIHRIRWISKGRVQLKLSFREKETSIDTTEIGVIQPVGTWRLER